MSFEDQFRSSLTRRVASLHAEPDWDDLTQRLRRRARRMHRFLIGALIVALFAGLGAGFALGRHTRSNSRSRLEAGAPPTTIVPPGAGIAGSSVPSNITGIETAPLTRLFRRTTDDGVTIRGYSSPSFNACPPASTLLIGELSTDAAVSSQTLVASTSGDVWLRAGQFGQAEGAATAWVIVHAPGTSRVRAVFDGGRSDTMTPVGGYAILASRVPRPIGTIELIDHDGKTTSRLNFPSSLPSPTVPAVCTQPVIPGPPTVLPAPGVQPTNLPAARASVTAAFTTLYNGMLNTTTRAAAVQDNAGIAALFDQVLRGPNGPLAKTAATHVDDIVFTSPSDAAIRYTVVTASTTYGPRVGRAVSVNGTWKVTRDTACIDLAAAGAPCPLG
jgi:hypothetical protein